MPIYKIEFGFQQGRAGWREAFHLETPGLTGALAQALPIARGRVNLLNSQASLLFVAVRDPEAGGSPLLGRPLNTTGRGTAVEPYQGVRVQLVANGGGPNQTYRSTTILRGIRAGMFAAATSGRQALTTAGRQEVQAYLSILAAQGARLRVKDRDASTASVLGVAPIAAWGGDTEGNPLAGFPASVALPSVALVLPLDTNGNAVEFPALPGSRVRLKGMRFGYPNGSTRTDLPRLAPVLGGFPGGVVVSASLPGAGVYVGGGQVQGDGVAYPRLSRGVPLGPGSKKCGRAPALGPLSNASVPEVERAGVTVIPPSTPGSPATFAVAPGGSPTRVLQCASDTFVFVLDGYNAGDDGKKYPIGIAQVLNAPNTWLVSLSGTDLNNPGSTGIPEDIMQGLNLPDNFGLQAVQAVLNNVPRGANLVLAGHSLGGMEAQGVAGLLTPLGYRVSRVITFGAPMNAIPLPWVNYRRFATARDPVLVATPLSLLMKSIGHPEQIEVPLGSLPDDWSTLHTWAYRDADVMKTRYGAFGNRLDDGPAQRMELGPVIRVPVK